MFEVAIESRSLKKMAEDKLKGMDHSEVHYFNRYAPLAFEPESSDTC